MKGINVILVLIIGAVIFLSIAIAWPAIIRAANLESSLVTLSLNCGTDGKECCGGFFCYSGFSCIAGKCYESKISVDFDDDLLIYDENIFSEYSNEWLYETTAGWFNNIIMEPMEINKLSEDCYGDFYDCSNCEYFYEIRNKTISTANGNPSEYFYPCDCRYCEECDDKNLNCTRCLDCKKYGYYNLPKSIACDLQDNKFYAENLSFCYKCVGCGLGENPFSFDCQKCEMCESGNTVFYDIFTPSERVKCKYCALWNTSSGESCYNCSTTKNSIFMDNYRCMYCFNGNNINCKKNTEFEFCLQWKNAFIESSFSKEPTPIAIDIPIKDPKNFEDTLIKIAKACFYDEDAYLSLDYDIKQYHGLINAVPLNYIKTFSNMNDAFSSFWDCGNINISDLIIYYNSPTLIFGNSDYGAEAYYYNIYTNELSTLFVCRQPILAKSQEDAILDIPKKLRNLDFINNNTWPGNIKIKFFDEINDEKTNKKYIIGIINFTDAFEINLQKNSKTLNDISNAIITGIQQWNILNRDWKEGAVEFCKKTKEYSDESDSKYHKSIFPENCTSIEIINSNINPSSEKFFSSYWNRTEKKYKCSEITNKTIVYRGEDLINEDTYEDSYSNIYVKPNFIFIHISNITCPDNYIECKIDDNTYSEKCNKYYKQICESSKIYLIPIIGIAKYKNDIITCKVT